MSSIIAKSLQRQSHLQHSSFAVARWRSELLRSNVSDYRRTCGNQTEAVSRSGINTLTGNCAGNRKRKRRWLETRA
jgi:hypothetical protein